MKTRERWSSELVAKVQVSLESISCKQYGSEWKGRGWYMVGDALEKLQEKNLHPNPFMKTNMCTGNSFVSLLLHVVIVSFLCSPHGKILKSTEAKGGKISKSLPPSETGIHGIDTTVI